MTKAKEIAKLINETKEGTLFCIKDFLDITSYENAKLILSRLENKNVIKRAYDGLYYRPIFSNIVNDYIPVSPYDFVKKISNMYGWKVCVYGEGALNYLGISTQVSAKYEFASDGPYREYTLNGKKIKFKHTNSRINNLTTRNATVIEAFRYIGKYNVTSNIIRDIEYRLSKSDIDELKQNKNRFPVWISNIIQNMESRL